MVPGQTQEIGPPGYKNWTPGAENGVLQDENRNFQALKIDFPMPEVPSMLEMAFYVLAIALLSPRPTLQYKEACP